MYLIQIRSAKVAFFFLDTNKDEKKFLFFLCNFYSALFPDTLCKKQSLIRQTIN